MATKNSKAKESGKSGKKEAGKTEARWLRIQGRHKTPYPEYRRAGLVFTRQPAEYTIELEALDVLTDDPHLDVTLLDEPAAAAASSNGKGDTGPDQNAGGEGDGAGGTGTGGPGADGNSGSSSGAEGA